MSVLGYNTIGSSNFSSGRWYSCMFTATDAGTITDFAAYLASTGSALFKFIIYNDNGGIPGSTILASSADTNFDTTPAWYTGSIGYTFAASEVLHFYIMANDNIIFYYDAGATAQTQQSSEDFNNWDVAPTPPTNVGSNDVVLSLYVNYTPSGSTGSKIFVRKGIRPALFKPGNSR